MFLDMATLLMACNSDPAVLQTDVMTCTWHHWGFDILTAKCLCAQDVKTRLAYVTRRKLHKAKREQQKKLQALEQRREVYTLATQGIKMTSWPVITVLMLLVWSYAGAILQSYSHVGVLLSQK